MQNKPSIFSFFTGLGFLDLGFENNGYSIAFVNELEQQFADAYLYSREKMGLPKPKYDINIGSATKLVSGTNFKKLQEMTETEKMNNLIGFIAGPPCPDFSVAGKNRGRDGEHGKLTAVYFDLICKLKPDFFLFENVKGLYRTKKHREFFEEMKHKANFNGYVLTEKLINAIEYGVPQYRERIILLGFKKELLKDFQVSHTDNILYLPDNTFPWEAYVKYKKDYVFSLPWPKRNQYKESSRLYKPRNIIKELTTEYWFRQNQVTQHENSKHVFKVKQGLPRFRIIEEGDDSRKSYKRLHRWRFSPTAAYGNNEVHLHPYEERRLSVAEVLAVQSLPKEFVLPSSMTLTAMFKGIGNGVPYLASHAIAASIIDFLQANQQQSKPISKFNNLPYINE